jgi:hypothetical protein
LEYYDAATVKDHVARLVKFVDGNAVGSFVLDEASVAAEPAGAEMHQRP